MTKLPRTLGLRVSAALVFGIFLAHTLNPLSALGGTPKTKPPLKAAAPVVEAASTIDPRFNYEEMLDLTREVMTRKPARLLLNTLFNEQLAVNPELAKKYGFEGVKIKNFTESQMMLLLQEAPSLQPEVRAYVTAVPRNADTIPQTPKVKALRNKWREKFSKLFEDKALFENFLRKNDPLEPFVMALAPGRKGYGRIKTYFTHVVKMDGKILPPDDLEKVLIEFIDKAEHELSFNFFDFDLDSVADALIRAHKRGVKVIGGIDKGVIETRPEVKAIYEKLTKAGIEVRAIDSVGLNHQKIVVRDHSSTEKAATFLSEGNATKSCMSLGGDAPELHSNLSIPNANMANVIEGQELALVGHHEITKTVVYGLRGREYPTSSAMKILGEQLGDKPRYIVIAFTPGGGLGDINQNFINRVIQQNPGGPHLFAQFAWASDKNEEALYESAVKAKKLGLKFEIKAVGDRPFAMQRWSEFLTLAGYRLEGEGDAKRYVKIPDSENNWLKLLGPKDYAEFTKNIRVAPDIYGNHTVMTLDGPFKLTSKIHHKLYVGSFLDHLIGIFGSFNFSEGAENNQEYIAAIIDEEVVPKMRAAILTIHEEAERSVEEEALRRNQFKEFDPETGKQPEAEKAGRNPKNVKNVSCKKLLKPTVGLTPR